MLVNTALAAIAGVGTAGAGMAPAGLAAADRTWSFALGFIVVLAASRARRWTWLWLAAWCIATTGTAAALALGAAALAAALYGLRRRSSPLGALAGALAVNALVRQPDHGIEFASAAATALAVVPVLVSGYVHSPSPNRQAARRGALLIGILCIAAAVMFGAAAARSRADIAAGVEHLERALDQGVRLDQGPALQSLRAAESQLGRASARLDSPWARPARLVPALGHQARAATVATGAAHSLTKAAIVTGESVDVAALELDAGAVPLDAIDRMRAPLAALAQVSGSAQQRLHQVESPWLAPALSSRLDEAAGAVDRLAPAAANAATVAKESDRLFGKGRPQTYFVGFTTPSEARGSGGLLASYLELAVADGRFSVVRLGRIEDLNAALRAQPDPPLVSPADYVDRWGRYSPQRYFQDLTLSPDFALVGDVIGQLYPRAGGHQLDGAITVDPYGVAAMLKLTGPITLASGQRLDSASAVDFLLKGQYASFGGDSQRVDALADVAGRTAEKLLGSQLKLDRSLVDTFATLVRERRVLVYHRDEAIEALFADLGAAGRLPRADGGDVFAFVHQNAGQNKIDAYLSRSVEYRVAIDSTGGATAKAVIHLHNGAPPSGLPGAVIGSNDQGLPQGTNKMYLTLYTNLSYVHARVDGVRSPLETNRESGLNALSVVVTIPAGATRTVEIDLRRPPRADPALRDLGGYSLTVLAPPLATPETTQVEITGPDVLARHEVSRPGVAQIALRAAGGEAATTPGQKPGR